MTAGALRRLVRKRAPDEACELCGARLPDDHRHLLEPVARQVLCACQACSILFDRPGSEVRYRTIPREVRGLAGVSLPDAVWDGLGLPVNMAFIHHSSAAGRAVAYYPSPGGATESLLPLDTWDRLLADNPALAAMLPDVEALLVNRVAGARDYYIAPIDECFRLVGLMRLSWQGISGGTEVWRQVHAFFLELERRAHPVGVAHGS